MTTSEVYWADPYQELRKVLGPGYARLAPEELEELFDQSGVAAEELESFLGSVQRIGQGIVRALPQVLPAVLPVVGTAVAGPVGGALGAVAGQALAPGQQQPVAAPGQPAAPAAAPPAAAPGLVPTPAAAPGPAAATDLFKALFRPETLLALFSMIMGEVGRKAIPVGQTPVPVGAFANAVSVLAGEAASRHQGGTVVPRYLQDLAGESILDPAIPEHRAIRLLELFEEADDPGWGGPEPWRGAGRQAWPYGDPEPGPEDHEADVLELVELEDEPGGW